MYLFPAYIFAENNLTVLKISDIMIRVLTIITSLVMCVTNSISGMPENGYRTEIFGRVVLGNEGVPFITLYAKGTSNGTSTDTNGNYMLVNLPEGSHVIKVQGIGYRSQEKGVKVARGETMELNFFVEQDIHMMEGVEVSGSRIGILRYLPGSAANIRSMDIMAIAPLSGNEVLRSVTGIHVVEEEGAGLRANIGVRGLDPDKSRNVLILEDGIPVALGPYGEPEMYYTPGIDRMSGVEILKGSGSILYGPQTVGGVINYITSDPPAESSGSISVRGGHGGYYTGQFGYGNTFGNTGFSINYLRRQAENLGPTRFVLNDISSKIRFKSSPRSNLTIKLGIYDENSNSTYVGLTQLMYDNGGEDYKRLAPGDNLDVRRYSLGVSHDFAVNDRLQLNSTAFAYTTTRNWRRQDFSSDPGSSNLSGVVWGDHAVPGGAIFMRNSTGNRNRHFEVAGFEPRLRYRADILGMDNVILAGSRLLYERAYEQRVNGTTAEAVSGNLRDDEVRTGHAVSSWLQNKLLVNDRLSLTAGLRTEMLNYERHILRTGMNDVSIKNNSLLFEIIPGAGINYNFNQQSGIFVGIHRGFAPPRIKDAISNEGEDLQLDAERSWNIEVGSRTHLFGFVGFELTLFRMDFSNQVIPVSESSGGPGTGYINGGRTDHRGVEAELAVLLSEIIQMPGSLSLNINTTATRSVFSGDRYVVQRISNGSINDTVFVNVRGNRTPYSPGLTASGAVNYQGTGGFGIRFSGHFTGEQYTDVLNTVNTGKWIDLMNGDPDYHYVQATADGRIGKLSPYFVMDLSAWFDFQRGLRLSMSVKNILNERYIATRRPQGIRVGLPRMVNGGLTLNF